MIVSEKLKDELEKLGCKVNFTNSKFWVNDDEYNKKSPDPEIPVDLKEESNKIISEVDVMEKIQGAKEQVSAWKDRVQFQSIANDSYYLSMDYKEDMHNLEYWQNYLRELENE